LGLHACAKAAVCATEPEVDEVLAAVCGSRGERFNRGHLSGQFTFTAATLMLAVLWSAVLSVRSQSGCA